VVVLLEEELVKEAALLEEEALLKEVLGVQELFVMAELVPGGWEASARAQRAEEECSGWAAEVLRELMLYCLAWGLKAAFPAKGVSLPVRE
jgi:hypothetical protein